jgi:uncharacterized protein
MSVPDILILLAIGFAAGLIAGGLGVGGGIILVPALVYFFKLSQHQAQGTSLAVLLFPVMALAVMNYYKSGFVNFKFVFIIIAAFVAGSYLGSLATVKMETATLKRLFGILMLIAGLKMVLGK